MPSQLSVHPAERPSRRVLLEEGDTVVVGRDPACGLVADDPRVSKQHAQIDWNGRAWALRDLASKNGTSVNGLSAAGQELAHGDWLSFGGVPARFDLLTREQADERRRDRALRRETSVRLRRRLEEPATPQETLQRLLDSAREVVGGDRGFVVLLGADGALRVQAVTGYEGADEAAGFTGSVGVVRRVAETAEPVLLSDVSRDALLGRRASILERNIAAVACLPLRARSRAIGFLYVDSRRAGTVLDELDLEILEGLAEHAGVVLGAGEVHQRLQQLRAVAAGAAAALERQLQAVRVHVEPA
jgi:adenylate cyclase